MPPPLSAPTLVDVELLHYDSGSEAIGAVSELHHRWLVERGAL